MISRPLWKNEWDVELRLLPQVESITNFDLQLTENVFLLWQFLKLYHSSSPQTRSIVDFLASKTPEALQWGKHIDDVMIRGAAKAQQLFNVLIAQGKKIQMKYAKKRLSENLSYYPIKNFIILERINTGSVGQVHLALDGKTGLFVAAKAIDKSTTQGDFGLFKKLKEEIILSSKMNHPNIVKTMSVLESKEKIIQIMEYCDGGDLISYVRNKLYLDESSAQYFFRKIVEGVQYMHQNNIAHRDLKPENIFLCKKQLSQREKTLIRIGKLPSCSEYDLKIGDFGASCIDEKNKLHFDIVGTLSYAAPEVLGCTNSTGYDGRKADIWSLGIILYAMFFGLLPFDNEEKDIKEAYNEIMKRKIVLPKNRAHKFSENAKNILFGMLNINPQKRLSLQEIVNHKWLEDSAKNKLEISHLHKKINVPFSSTVAYPLYPVKQLLHQNMLLTSPHTKINHGEKVGNVAKYGNVTRIEKGINGELLDISDKANKAYAFSNVMNDKCSTYESPSYDQMNLNNFNFSDYQNFKHFSNDDVSVYHKTGVFYNNANANTDSNQNLYHFEKFPNKHDSYNDLLIQYTGNGNPDVNFYTKSGNPHANVIYRNNFNKIETHADPKIIDSVANGYRTGEEFNGVREKTTYEKLHLPEKDFTDNSPDKNKLDLLNKYVNSSYYKNNENAIVDYEVNEKKYYDDKTHLCKNSENVLIKSNTEDNFYFTKKKIKDAFIQNYEFVQKPKELIELNRVNNISKNTKILNITNIESGVQAQDFQKGNEKSTDYISNNQYNRNLNYDVKQILYKASEVVPNSQTECINMPYKYYYYNESNGMYYDAVENVNTFAENFTTKIVPEKHLLFSNGSNNCYITDSLNNNSEKMYTVVPKGSVLNETAVYVKNPNITNMNEHKIFKQNNKCQKNSDTNYTKNCLVNESGKYTRGVSEFVSPNDFHYHFSSNGKIEADFKKRENKQVYRTCFNNDYRHDFTVPIFGNDEFPKMENINIKEDFSKREDINKKEKLTKIDNVTKNRQEVVVSGKKNVAEVKISNANKKKEITDCIEGMKKNEPVGKEKKKISFYVNQITENISCDKDIHIKSDNAESNIIMPNLKSKGTNKTDITTTKKNDKKIKESKTLQEKKIAFSIVSEEDAKDINESELVKSKVIGGSKRMSVLSNKKNETECIKITEIKENLQPDYKRENFNDEEKNDLNDICENQESATGFYNNHLYEEDNKIKKEKKEKKEIEKIEKIETMHDQKDVVKENDHFEEKEEDAVIVNKILDTYYKNNEEISMTQKHDAKNESEKEQQNEKNEALSEYLNDQENSIKDTQEILLDEANGNMYYSNVLSFFKNVHLNYKKKCSSDKLDDTLKEKTESAQDKENKKKSKTKKGENNEENEKTENDKREQKEDMSDDEFMNNSVLTISESLKQSVLVDEGIVEADDATVENIGNEIGSEQEEEQREQQEKGDEGQKVEMQETEQKKEKEKEQEEKNKSRHISNDIEKEEEKNKNWRYLENKDGKSEDALSDLEKIKFITLEEVRCVENVISEAYNKNNVSNYSCDIVSDTNKKENESYGRTFFSNVSLEDNDLQGDNNESDKKKSYIFNEMLKKSEKEVDNYLKKNISEYYADENNSCNITNRKTMNFLHPDKFIISADYHSIDKKYNSNCDLLNNENRKIYKSLKTEFDENVTNKNNVTLFNEVPNNYVNCADIKAEKDQNKNEYTAENDMLKNQSNKNLMEKDQHEEYKNTLEMTVHDIEKKYAFLEESQNYMEWINTNSKSPSVSGNSSLNSYDLCNNRNTGENDLLFCNIMSAYKKEQNEEEKNNGKKFDSLASHNDNDNDNNDNNNNNNDHSNNIENNNKDNKDNKDSSNGNKDDDNNPCIDINRNTCRNNESGENKGNNQNDENEKMENVEKVKNDRDQAYIYEKEKIEDKTDYIKMENQMYVDKIKEETEEREAEIKRCHVDATFTKNTYSREISLSVRNENEVLCNDLYEEGDNIFNNDKPVIDLCNEDISRNKVEPIWEKRLDGLKETNDLGKCIEFEQMQSSRQVTNVAKNPVISPNACIENENECTMASDKMEILVPDISNSSFNLNNSIIQEMCNNIRSIYKKELSEQCNKKEDSSIQLRQEMEDAKSIVECFITDEQKTVVHNPFISHMSKISDVVQDKSASVIAATPFYENQIWNNSVNDALEKLRNEKNKRNTYESKEELYNQNENMAISSGRNKIATLCEESIHMKEQILNDRECKFTSVIERQNRDGKSSTLQNVQSNVLLKKGKNVPFQWGYKNEKNMCETEDNNKGYTYLVETADVGNIKENSKKEKTMEKVSKKKEEKNEYLVTNAKKKTPEENKTHSISVENISFLKKECKGETFAFHDTMNLLIESKMEEPNRIFSETKITKLKDRNADNSIINNRESAILDLSNKIKNNCVYIQNQNYEIIKGKKNMASKITTDKINIELNSKNISNSASSISNSHFSNDSNNKLFYDIDYVENVDHFNKMMLNAFSQNNSYGYITNGSPAKNIYKMNESAANSLLTSSNYFYNGSALEDSQNYKNKNDVRNNTRMNKSFIQLFSKPYMSKSTNVFKNGHNSLSKNTNARNTCVVACKHGGTRQNQSMKSNVKSKVDLDLSQNKLKWMNIFTRNSQKVETKGKIIR